MNSIYGYIISFITGMVLTALISIGINCDSDTPHQSETLVKADSNTFERYEQRIDTIQNTIIKTLWEKQNDPEVIIQEKITYRDVEKFRDYDLSLGFKKSGTTLTIYAVNLNDSIVKEVTYEDVFSNFEAWSANDKVIVKSQKFSWNGINVGFEHNRPVTDLKNSYQNKIDLTTGLKYKDKYSLDAGAEYNIEEKDIKLKAKVTVKLF